MGWINCLPDVLRQRLRTKGEHVVKVVGYTILLRVHCFSPNFPFVRIFERFGSRAAVGGVVA
jgi:hypothetical protein